MLTIAEALQLPIFKDANIVTGQAGLNNSIRWVHIVSVPERSSYSWTKGGELILTVGLGLRANLERQQEIVPRLVEHGIAGLVLSVGHYFDHTPPIMVEQAKKLGFPIIELAGDVPFVEVTESIFTHIVNEQYATLQRAQAIHKALMDVVLNGGTLQHLVEALAKLLDKSITIESNHFDVLASVQLGKIDPARQRSIDSGRTAPEIIEQLQNNGLQKRLIQHNEPIHVAAQPQFGIEMERMVAPIVVTQNLLGYLWIIADKGSLTDLDHIAIEQAATVAALLVYKEKAVQESQRSMRGDFFSQLLRADEYSPSELESQATIFDFRLNRNYQVLVIEDEQKSNDVVTRLPSHIEPLLQERIPALVVVREQHIVVVLQAHQNPNGTHIAEELIDSLNYDSPLLIGVGTSTEHLNGIASSYEQGLESLAISRSMGQRQGIFPFEQLGLLHWLYQLPDKALEDNIYFRALSKLDSSQTEQHKQLFGTLEVFLEYGGRMKEAAEALYVHRNTLTYRLERIEDLIGLELRDSNTQINLFVALKSYKLQQSNHR